MQKLVAKEMESALAGLRGDDAAALYEVVTERFEWYRDKRSGFVDKKYDDDTNHGANKPQQGIWDERIAGWASKGVMDLAGPP